MLSAGSLPSAAVGSGAAAVACSCATACSPGSLGSTATEVRCAEAEGGGAAWAVAAATGRRGSAGTEGSTGVLGAQATEPITQSKTHVANERTTVGQPWRRMVPVRLIPSHRPRPRVRTGGRAEVGREGRRDRAPPGSARAGAWRATPEAMESAAPRGELSSGHSSLVLACGAPPNPRMAPWGAGGADPRRADLPSPPPPSLTSS